jgi:phytoene dehydrogenase-like protein
MKGRIILGDSYDAIVIGGGIGGLVAAAYLARARVRVLVLEARHSFGGRAETYTFADRFRAPCLDHALYALDPRILDDLGVYQHGLVNLQSDMSMIALRPGGSHIVMPNGPYRAGHALAMPEKSDGRAYKRFRREILTLAGQMRPLWQSAGRESDVSSFRGLTRRLSLKVAERLEIFSRMSAAGYLDQLFESDALKAALAFDVCTGGFSPHEAGSALMLIWRAAQGNAWRPGAVSQPRGGPGAFASELQLVAEKAGAELRSGVRVSSIIAEEGRAFGVMLEDGSVYRAATVLSSLSARQTLLDLVPPGAIGFGALSPVPDQSMATAKILLALQGPPPIPGLAPYELDARFVIAERPETADEAKGMALLGRTPNELVMEATVPTAADPDLAPDGIHVVSVLVPLLPAAIDNGWAENREALGKRVVAKLELYAPGLKDRIVARAVLTPQDIALRYGEHAVEAASPLPRLLAGYEMRVRTPLPGLYLCGTSAEPVSAISGRAGRIAARLAFANMRQQRERAS